jgi:hypothetical protein
VDCFRWVVNDRYLTLWGRLSKAGISAQHPKKYNIGNFLPHIDAIILAKLGEIFQN